MEKLSKDDKLLLMIKKRLDELMTYRFTPPEIRSTDLYSHIKLDAILLKEFPWQKPFNQFLKRLHKNGRLKDIIPNCDVDTRDPYNFQWRFYRELKYVSQNQGKNTDLRSGANAYYKNGKNISVGGIKVRSYQEKQILNALLPLNNVSILYEPNISVNGEFKIVDFCIKSKINHITIFWEHFGMTSDENYAADMAEKIEWYRLNSFRPIEEGGNMIYTYYKDSTDFDRDLEMYLNRLNKLLARPLH